MGDVLSQAALRNGQKATNLKATPATALMNEGQKKTVSLPEKQDFLVRLQVWLNEEEIPNILRRSLPLDYDDFSDQHVERVAAIINHLIGCYVDQQNKLGILTVLGFAHSDLLKLREKSDRNSQSVLLRDAERYIWGRKWVKFYNEPEFDGNIFAGILANAPMLSDTVYNLLKKGLKEIDFMRTNKDRSTSIQGGSFWFLMGLVDYSELDSKSGAMQLADAKRYYQLVEIWNEKRGQATAL